MSRFNAGHGLTVRWTYSSMSKMDDVTRDTPLIKDSHMKNFTDKK